MEQAINFEVRRQIEIIEDGGKVLQETRLYDPDKDETRSMRLKEDEMDYRYFPDPDLLPLEVTPEWIDEIRAGISKLPWVVAAEYKNLYGLSPSIASELTNSLEQSLVFENACIRNSDTDFPTELMCAPAFVKRVANWVVGEVSRKLNEDGGDAWQFWMDPKTLGRLVLREHEGKISSKTARDL